MEGKERVSKPSSQRPTSESYANLHTSFRHYGTNPATGEKLWPVPIASQKDVDEAVEAAQTAFESFRNTSLAERKEMLGKFKDALLANSDEMTELLCAETGKPVSIDTTDLF